MNGKWWALHATACVMAPPKAIMAKRPCFNSWVLRIEISSSSRNVPIPKSPAVSNVRSSKSTPSWHSRRISKAPQDLTIRNVVQRQVFSAQKLHPLPLRISRNVNWNNLDIVIRVVNICGGWYMQMVSYIIHTYSRWYQKICQDAYNGYPLNIFHQPSLSQSLT